MTTLRLKPQWRDLDALGHVNNAVYSTWLENAREAWWREVNGPFDLFPFLLARTEIDFRAPVRWRDEVAVSLSVERIGRTSIELRYEIDGPAGRVADARTVLVMIDSEGRPAPVPDALRRRLGAN